MNTTSKIMKFLFWVIVIALLVTPVGLIIRISDREKSRYAAPDIPEFVDTSYGAIAVSERMDVKERITVNGVFQSFTYEYVELKQEDPSRIRWEISVGDEIQKGQRIGTYKGEAVLAECSGLVDEIQSYSMDDAYIKVQKASPVELVSDVSPGTLVMMQYAKELTTADGEPAELVYASEIRNADGRVRVRLQIESEKYYLNQHVEDMVFYTGNVFMQTLVLPKGCLYQKKTGEGEPWYVREVKEDGTLFGEREVELGYEDDGYVCVTGIEEGRYFDASYAQFSGGGDDR